MLLRTRGRRLRVLTWHVHGNYLYYLSQAPHEFHLVTRPGNPPGYAGKVGQLPWGENLHEVPAERVPEETFDVVLYQHRIHWERDRQEVLTESQRKLPRLYIEHDPPFESPFGQRHWAQDRGLVLVHVTHFNRLMWDSGVTRATVIEHGVKVPEGVRYSGDLAKGLVIVNHLRERGRRLGADAYADMRKRVPLDLVGMDAESMEGLGEVGNMDLAAFSARYRFLFNPMRWTSLGLALIESMMVGLPIVGFPTTELATVIRNGESGYLDNDPRRVLDAMRTLIAVPELARSWGEAARKQAAERFDIRRFAADWDRLLTEVAT